MKEKLKNYGPVVLRVGLSLALLVWIFSRIDYKHTWAVVKDADAGYMFAAFATFFLTCILILWRWIILMRALNLKFKRFNSARWFFIGQFFNLVLPTSVGGDVIKGFGMAKESGSKPKVFASIVLDRLIGFLAIVVVASVSFFFGRKIIQNHFVIISILSMFFVSLVMAIIFFSHRIFSRVTKAFKPWPRIRDGLMSLHYDLVLMKGKYMQAVQTMSLSILAQIILAIAYFLTAKGMHQHISLVYFIIFSPLVCVVTSLPSIGGLGVREVGWASLLSLVGVPQAVSVGLSLINFSFMIIVGLIGGVFYVTSLSSGRVQYHQADAQLKPGKP